MAHHKGDLPYVPFASPKKRHAKTVPPRLLRSPPPPPSPPRLPRPSRASPWPLTQSPRPAAHHRTPSPAPHPAPLRLFSPLRDSAPCCRPPTLLHAVASTSARRAPRPPSARGTAHRPKPRHPPPPCAAAAATVPQSSLVHTTRVDAESRLLCPSILLCPACPFPRSYTSYHHPPCRRCRMVLDEIPGGRTPLRDLTNVNREGTPVDDVNEQRRQKDRTKRASMSVEEKN
ncbi:hypothetical protein BS78_04G130700 [Paspalum vaginatum]|nr:hypothetical protein BS78_04G130700 [Paspalum vaginatum]